MSFPPSSSNKTSSPTDGRTIDLTIRFSAALPDLPLSISPTTNTNTSTLKQLIRTSLPPEHSNKRIRLIYAGKALEDHATLNRSLKLASRIAKSPLTEEVDISKGKTPVHDPPLARIYIHCSIGEVVLTPDELAAESLLADKPTTTPANANAEDATNTTNTTPTPRGFDRLLTSGFSGAEVQNLRLQFMAIQSHTHTPDTMPSPNTMRGMEDRWLDNSVGTGANDSGRGVGQDDALAGALDDMIWGATMGFFWPVGCLMWGTREDGVWSQRRKMAVVVGVVLNIGLGFVRYTS